MKTIKKFTTFEALKSCESETKDFAVRLKKHTDFEKAIKNIKTSELVRVKVNKN